MEPGIYSSANHRIFLYGPHSIGEQVPVLQPDQCSFRWQLKQEKNGAMVTMDTGYAARLSVPPGEQGMLNLQLPATWDEAKALYLTATDPHGKEIFTWSWPIDRGNG
ncbi:hypothetical protein [Paraflavitalea speifideaquila]|uniref:hypothetical protein n=1 Tax=Paraflavitalea speifideaquila TaxID=3076558 RepID=UPI0028E1AA3F|nr:hypothetical protein [Paraflavitalea speifideiaquila]